MTQTFTESGFENFRKPAEVAVDSEVEPAAVLVGEPEVDSEVELEEVGLQVFILIVT